MIPIPAGTIPLGATHFFHNPQRPNKVSTDPWRKTEDGQWSMYMDGEWQRISGSKAHMFVPLEDVARSVDGFVAPSLRPLMQSAVVTPKAKPVEHATSWKGPGNGLPSAGDKIEFDRGGKDWIEVVVFAVEHGIDDTADVLFRHGEGWGFIDSNSERIRPYVSPEERLRQAREAIVDKAVIDIRQISSAWPFLPDQGKLMRAVVEAMIEAGYRKP